MPEILDEQLSAIGEAEKRARLALFITALASAAILGALWNAYLSWDAQWSQSPKPAEWGERVLLERQIQTWQQSNEVSVSLLGIHLSASDAAVLGSSVLLVLAFWVFINLRHLNGEVAMVIRGVDDDASTADRWRIFNRIQAGMVLEPPVAAPPIASVKDNVKYSLPSKSSAAMSRLLLFLPAITVLFIVASDLYFAFVYDSPFRPGHDPAWKSLPDRYRVQLIAIDSYAVIADLLLIRFAFLASKYHSATIDIVREFWLGLVTPSPKPVPAP